MEKLSPPEEAAMLAVWKTGEGMVKGSYGGVVQPPYTTLASTIRNLEKKGIPRAAACSAMLIYIIR